MSFRDKFVNTEKKVRKESDMPVLDGYKELTPVVYGKDAIKYIYYNISAGLNLFEMHWHERMEILRVISGSMELYLGEKHFTICPGQAAVINPRTLHCGYAGASGVEYHTIMFDVEKFCNGTNVSEKYLRPVSSCEIGFYPVASEPEVIEQIDRLAACFRGEKASGSNPLLAMGIVYEVIGSLYKYCVDHSKEMPRVNKEFSEVLEYIGEHCCEKLTARSLSEYFNYNETYFCRRFKAVTGFTVMKYIQVLRMEEAQRLLENTREEISVIAAKCGFSDTCYFSNCFRKHFGYTPTKFRSLHLPTDEA